MVATVQQIIGKINPQLYAKNWKELLKTYGSADKISAEEIEPNPLSEHRLVYDSTSETLEPIYFFIIDLMNDMELSPQKFVDNFSSSPGSGHFSELGQRATIMQQQGTKILADVNVVLRSVLNIIYDLKEFKIRLQHYEDARSKEDATKDAAILALKQIWMDKVDAMKGNSSIKAMAMSQLAFVTLIDAFLFAKDEKQVDKIDLNDRVKRILKPRIHEFNIWVEQSEKELRKRYEMEKAYLKSQVNSLKLYSRWAKPYLKSAAQMEMKEFGRSPALVKAFNTILLELTILGKSKLNIRDLALSGELPKEFEKFRAKRDYYMCILIDFEFRGIPQRVQSHYVFGGRAEITFRAYTLNKDELELLDKEMEKSDITDVLKLIEGSTTESLNQIQDEINEFLEEKTTEETQKKERKSSKTSNSIFYPFIAMTGKLDKAEEEKSENSKKEAKPEKLILKDDWIEKNHLRKIAGEKAKEITFKLFDIYKKSHGMPSYT